MHAGIVLARCFTSEFGIGALLVRVQVQAPLCGRQCTALTASVEVVHRPVTSST